MSAAGGAAAKAAAGSIRRRLTLAFVGLAAAPLVLAGGILAWQSFRVQKAQVLVHQKEVARRVAGEVSCFLRGLEDELRGAARAVQLSRGELPLAGDLLDALQARRPAFQELSLLDGRGREVLRRSRVEVFGEGDLRDRSEEPEYEVPSRSGGAYFGPVLVHPATGEPFLTAAVPLPERRTGGIEGVLVARVRFKPVWELIGRRRPEPGQDVYVASPRGEILAHRNPSLVLRERKFPVPDSDGFHRGLDGSVTALAHETVALGQGALRVVAEQQLWTALGLAVRVVSVVLALLVLVFLVAGAVGFYVVKRIVRPVEALSDVASAIQAGDDEREAPVDGDDEIARLALAFNAMTRRLRGTLKSLEAEVSERQEAQAALASEKERLAVTLGSIGDGVIATDVSGRVTLMNRVAEDLTGWTAGEAEGAELRAVFPLVHGATREACENPVERVLASGETQGRAGHALLLARDGREYAIADSGSPIRDRAGSIHGVVLVFRDVTAQERMEEELARAQQLESISLLAGGIAHDFNNLLTAILGNISLARLRMTPGDRADEPLARAEAGSLRARELTQQLLTFARGGAPSKQLTDVGRIADSASRFACTGSAAACSVEISEGLWPAEVDGGQIAQVLNNLVLNAVQAMPGGGTVEVRVENAPLEAANPYALPAGSYVRVSVRDQGPGIAATALPRIFDPYYTTKERGKGLGLAVCHSIISKHAGRITARSTPGAGATLEFLVPASPGAEPRAVEPADEPLRPGRGRVLVMDDEESIRALAVGLLGSLGYEVEQAADGATALALYERALAAGARFDAVVSDLTIPGGMGGRELAERLRKLDPAATIVVSSGYANDPILASYRDFGFQAAVAKPYRVAELHAALMEALRGRAGRAAAAESDL